MGTADSTATDPGAVEIADAEVVSEETTAELVHAPRRGEVLRPLDVSQQKDAMRIYQEGLHVILDESDWQAAGYDRQAGRERRFVKKSGWRKIAAWFDLSIELVRDTVERDETGNVTRACVWARAVAPSGRFADGDGYCDVTESRFNPAEEKKRESARAKLENDLRGTATTRAVNRAISNLVGMGEVSAEEISSEPSEHGPPFGPAYDKDVIGKAVAAACIQLAQRPEDSPEAAKEKGIALFKMVIKNCGGYMPQAAALALIDASTAGSVVPDVEAPEL